MRGVWLKRYALIRGLACDEWYARGVACEGVLCEGCGL